MFLPLRYLGIAKTRAGMTRVNGLFLPPGHFQAHGPRRHHQGQEGLERDGPEAGVRHQQSHRVDQDIHQEKESIFQAINAGKR